MNHIEQSLHNFSAKLGTIIKIFLICALPAWMIVRSLMPSETSLEYLDRLSQEIPKLNFKADQEVFTYFAGTQNDTTVITMTFQGKLEVINPDSLDRYLLIYKKDSLGNITPLETDCQSTTLIGGEYIINSYDVMADSLLFTRKVKAKRVNAFFSDL